MLQHCFKLDKLHVVIIITITTESTEKNQIKTNLRIHGCPHKLPPNKIFEYTISNE